MTSGYTRAVNDLLGEVDRMDDRNQNTKWLRLGPYSVSMLSDNEVYVRESEALSVVECLKTENQRLIAALEDIAEYTGEGPITVQWQSIVKHISDKARAALKGASK